jgi:hypothetical protein
VPFDEAITAIARRRKRSAREITGSLEKAGWCRIQRIAGEDVAVPTELALAEVPRGGRSSTAAKAAEAAAWRALTGWLLASVAMTAEDLEAAVGSGAGFVAACGEAVASGLLGQPAAAASPADEPAARRTPVAEADDDDDAETGTRRLRRPRLAIPDDSGSTQDERLKRIQAEGLTVRKVRHRRAPAA